MVLGEFSSVRWLVSVSANHQSHVSSIGSATFCGLGRLVLSQISLTQVHSSALLYLRPR